MKIKDQQAMAKIYTESLHHPGMNITDGEGHTWHVSRDGDGTYFASLEDSDMPTVVDSGSSMDEALNKAKSQLQAIFKQERRRSLRNTGAYGGAFDDELDDHFN